MEGKAASSCSQLLAPAIYAARYMQLTRPIRVILRH